MSSLTGLFKPAPESPQEQDKLVDLFRNRAELKKEFAALRSEKYQLQDRIKQHEGATARVQQKLDHLENLLLDRDWVYNVVAYFQLRRLGLHCHAKLQRFAEHLKQQREQQVHSKAIAAFEEKRRARSAQIQAELNEIRSQAQSMEDRLQSQRHKLLTMNGFVKLFRGRRLSSNIDGIAESILDSQRRESELLYALDENDKCAPPDHEGLDCATKRKINFMIIALAQQLYLHFEDNELASLAKEANEKSAGAINYGNKRDCDEILHHIDKQTKSLGSASDLVDVLQGLAKKIAEQATFRSEDDPVPVPRSVATIYFSAPNGLSRQKDVNILGENYFGVAKVLSR